MFAEPREAFENTEQLADEAWYDGRKTIRGYFDNDYTEAQFANAGVGSSIPVFDVWAERVDADPTNQTLEVDGVEYIIVRGEPHSAGRMRLVLRR